MRRQVGSGRSDGFDGAHSRSGCNGKSLEYSSRDKIKQPMEMATNERSNMAVYTFIGGRGSGLLSAMGGFPLS